MTIEQSKLQALDLISLYHEKSNSLVEILPSFGGIISKMVINGTQILKIGDTETAILADKSYPSAWLFPWPNRVRDGKYIFEGTDYQLDINENRLNNSLHGLLLGESFEIEQQLITEKAVSVTLSYSFKGTEAGFPFAFELKIKFILGANGLSIQFTIQNKSDSNMPFGLGWHPYFGFEGESLADFQIKFDAKHFYHSDQQMIPMGTGLYTKAGEWNDLSNKNYDTVFAIRTTSDNQFFSTFLKSKISGKTIEIQQDSSFDYLVLYTPPYRKTIAIEPMTCNTDAFNNKQGLAVLKAGETKQFDILVNVF